MIQNHDDETFLDRLLESAIQQLENGQEPQGVSALDIPPHLVSRARETIHLARETSIVLSTDTPVVSGYTIESSLGRGGMGSVYLARQDRIGGRLVALKVFPAFLRHQPESKRRFLSEVRALAKMKHSNVVEIYDVISSESILAYAMEWIEAGSFGEFVEEFWTNSVEPVSSRLEGFLGEPRVSESGVRFICRVGIQVARALAHVHMEGLLHRDVKPSNILIRPDGTAVLVDFGLARDAERTAHTQEGSFLGTLSYASPEQLRGDHQLVDGRSDVYSLGVSLYHALTGSIPFQQRTVNELLRALESGDCPPLRKANPRLPSDLQTIIETAMDPMIQRRYQTAEDLADDLERLLALHPIRARRASLIKRSVRFAQRNRRSVLLTLLGGNLFLLLVAILWLVDFVPRATADQLRRARRVFLTSDDIETRIVEGDEPERPERPALSLQVAQNAVKEYENLRLRHPFVGLATELERETVALCVALAESRESLPPGDTLGDLAPLTWRYARSWRAVASGPPPLLRRIELDEASPLDLHCLGLLAFLCGDFFESDRAWRMLGPFESCGAFLQIARIQSFTRMGFPATALDLLDRAEDSRRELGDIHVSLMLKVMKKVEETISTPRRELSRREGAILEARRSYAASTAKSGDHRGIAQDLVVLVRYETRREDYRALLVRHARAWWQGLDGEAQFRTLLEAFEENPWDDRSFFALLQTYSASCTSLAIAESLDHQKIFSESAPMASNFSALEHQVDDLFMIHERMEATDMKFWTRLREYPLHRQFDVIRSRFPEWKNISGEGILKKSESLRQRFTVATSMVPVVAGVSMLVNTLLPQQLSAQVVSHQKISALSGGFAGPLDAEDNFGSPVVNIGDLDGDGVNDLAVGAPLDDDGGSDRGAVWILFLRDDGTVKAHQKISSTMGGFGGALSDEASFGAGIALLGDINGDQCPELAVGAGGDADGGTRRGAVWIFSLETDGTVKSQSETKISDTAGCFDGVLEDFDNFGRFLVRIYDLDGDGIDELGVHLHDDDGGSEAGAIWILFLEPSGKVRRHQKISALEGGFTGGLTAGDQFGNSFAALGDLDGDGICDLSAGAPLDDDGGPDRGAVWILFLNPDGTVKGHKKISDAPGPDEFPGGLDDEDYFGQSQASLGDRDGDGVCELAVGANRDDDGGIDRGCVWILHLDPSGCVLSVDKISDTAGNFPGELDDHDRFGQRLTTVGDLNRDGGVDLAVGASWDDDGASNEGAVWILFLEKTCVAGSVGSDVSPIPCRSDLLTVNGQAGQVSIFTEEPITVGLLPSPLGPQDPSYVLWAWIGPPTHDSSLQVGSVFLGCAVNPTPFQVFDSPQPYRCVIRGMPEVFCAGVTVFNASPAVPFSIPRPGGFRTPITFTLQAVIQDNGAPNALGFSMTNGVEVSVSAP